MSDTDDAFSPSFLEDAQRRQAASSIINANEDDPEKAARSIELGDATGVNPALIHPNLENFEQQHKIAVNNKLISDNSFLQGYLNSNPMAASLSHDDIGALDAASQKMVAIPAKSGLRRAVDAFKEGFGELSGKAIFSDPYLRRPSDVDFVLNHPEIGYPLLTAAGMVGAPIVGASKVLSGVLGVVNELGGRELAGMLEYGLIRGDMRSVGTGGTTDIANFGNALKAFRPWLAAGKEAPIGVDPMVDKVKVAQAKTDIDAIADAVAESVKSATRERSPDYYTTFARQHVGDQEVGISADKIRELYGDKTPTSDDNLLGFIPDLSAKLLDAESTGGDVKVPLADLLGRIDPEVFKELKDDIRVRPDGITVEEGKTLAEQKDSAVGVIPEPGPLVRGHAGLEPLFSIGDRKLTIKKEPGKYPSLDDPAIEADKFQILDENGQKRGWLRIVPFDSGKKLYVDNIGGNKGANMFGPALTRDIARQLKVEYPEAEQVGGFRMSGARDKAGTEREVWMKLNKNAEWEFGNAPRERPPGQLGEIGQGISTWLRPPEDWSPHEQEIAKAIQDEFQKIVPGKASRVVGDIVEDRTDASTNAIHLPGADPAKDLTIFSLMSKDPIGDVWHEGIHQLRRGFFTTEEWSTLKDAALENNWHGKFDIDKFYKDKSVDIQLEESIAEAFRDWMASDKPAAPEVHTIFERLKAFFEKMKNRIGDILGRDFTWDEIFGKVAEGEVGSREQGRGVAGMEALRSIGDRPDIGGPEADALREKIAKLSGELSVAKSTGKDILPAQQAELKELRERLRSTTSGTFNMTVDQYSRYMKLIERRNAEDLEAASKAALEQQRKTQTREWKANRTEMRDTVREEIEGRPEIAIDRLMTSEKVKFHPDTLSEKQKAALPKEYIQKKDGLDPDSVAGFFGFHSGDALVERLAQIAADRKAADMTSREWSNHLIDTETDRRMEQEYGNLNQSILEDAKEQAISETQLDLLHEEVLYLGQLAKSQIPITKAELRQWNKDIFDKTPLGQISTDEYLRTAGKAGKAAEMSLLKEDFVDAFREKQRQNNAMIKASYAKAYEKARKSFDRQAKTFQKREVPSVSQEWTNWIHDILQRTGNRVNRSLQDLQENIARQSDHTLTDFIESKEAESFGLRETPVADFLLDPAFRKDMKELTADQFYGLKQSLDVLVKQGRDEKKITVAGEVADREAVLSEMRDKLQTFPTKALPDEAPKATALLKLPRMFMAGMTNIETLLNRWDRADPRGIFNRYVMQPLAKAANYKSALEREYAKAYGNLGEIKNGDKFIDAPFADPLTRTEAEPDGRPWPGFTRKHVLAMLQNAGNKSNWKVLAKGYSADPDALMGWLHRNTTKEDWDRAQKMGDTLFHSLVDRADTVYENLTGATIEKIPLEPIETPYGTYPGWYHPLIADPIRKEVWVKDAETGQWSRKATGRRGSVMDDSDYFHASIANGYTKRRTGATYPLDLNFDVVPSRIKQMIHDIAFRQVIVETEKVFGNKALQAEVTKHYGAIYTDLLMPYLRNMAGAESIPSRAGAEASRVSEYLRQNAISTYIGFNPYTALKHGPTAWVMSMREVGGVNFLNAVRGLYGQSSELGLSNSAFAMKHSEELQRRERHWQDTIAGEHKEIEGVSTLREKVIEKGSWLVAQSDMMSAKPTWVAEYNTRTAEGLSHGEAVDLADRAVRRAHGSTAQTNQPAMVRGGGPLHGWLTSVYGFFGTAMQRRIEIAHQLNDVYQLGKDAEIKQAASNLPKITGDIFTYVIWPTVVEEWVTGLTTEDKRGWGAHALGAITMGLSSSVLYLRDLVHAFTTGHDPGVGLLSSPLHDVANVVRDARRGKEAFNRQHAGKTVGDALTVFGEATGLAPKTIANAARFGIDMVNRQQRPKTAPDWLRGVTRGTAQKRQEK